MKKILLGDTDNGKAMSGAVGGVGSEWVNGGR